MAAAICNPGLGSLCESAGLCSYCLGLQTTIPSWGPSAHAWAIDPKPGLMRIRAWV